MTSLEGWRSAIELRPRARRETRDGPPAWHRQRTGYGTSVPSREGGIQTRPRRTVVGAKSGLRGTVGYVRFQRDVAQLG